MVFFGPLVQLSRKNFTNAGMMNEPAGKQTQGSAQEIFVDPLHIADLLCLRGWALFDLNALELTGEEAAAANKWEAVFDTAFNQSHTEKESAGVYRVEQGVSVGYRVDNEREFFETRMTSSSNPEPNFPSVKDYATTASCLYSIFCKVGNACLQDIGQKIGLDPQCLIDLTDLGSAGILPQCAPSKTSIEFGKKELIPTLSSSLLRICKYKSERCDDCEALEEAPSIAEESATSQENIVSEPAGARASAAPTGHVWFGAHTDSTFLTISLCSSTPGLELVDQQSNTWVCPEKLLPPKDHATVFTTVHKAQIEDENVHTLSSVEHCGRKRYAIVFVGEFLQVLTKNRFRAAVHRVKNFRADKTATDKNTSSNQAALSSSASSVSTSSTISLHDASTRISCPFIIRGRNSAIIDFHNTDRYCHPGGAAALTDDKVPNLDGTNMHLMHKLLDLKRQKCFRENGSAEGASWVLSAYPVPPLPADS